MRGWFFESHRHSLARRGISPGRRYNVSPGLLQAAYSKEREAELKKELAGRQIEDIMWRERPQSEVSELLEAQKQKELLISQLLEQQVEEGKARKEMQEAAVRGAEEAARKREEVKRQFEERLAKEQAQREQEQKEREKWQWSTSYVVPAQIEDFDQVVKNQWLRWKAGVEKETPSKRLQRLEREGKIRRPLEARVRGRMREPTYWISDAFEDIGNLNYMPTHVGVGKKRIRMKID